MTAFSEALNNSAGAGAQPAVVRLAPTTGAAPATAPPVRIFLGTEDAQHEAERIFVYAIEQVRDPSRTYEIHLMKNLAGFNRRWWRTGFTNYRFAIPDLAGRRGKAIYNDVDQVYTADPALLFDLDMQGHGYLAVSPADTSVMLIDCERMAEWWNHAAASRRHKHSLTRGPARVPGLWGALDPGWNARDAEYVEGKSRLLHFTALHTQPWQPTPDQYSYRPHPLGEVWHRLKRAADAQGYTVFTSERPSPAFRVQLARHRMTGAPPGPAPGWSGSAQRKLGSSNPRDCLQITIGPVADDGHARCKRSIDLAAQPWPEETADTVMAHHLLEHLPPEDVPWVLHDLFARARRLLCIAVRVAGRGEHPPGDSSASRSPGWWRKQILAAARHAPQVDWHLDVHGPAGRAPLLACSAAGTGHADAPPRVLLLLEGNPRNDAAGRSLAETLEWPWAEQPAGGGNTEPYTATDLILTCGPRGASEARHRRRKHGNGARLIHLGRPGTPLADFDLVISRPQDQLPIRPNVQYLSMPLSPVDSGTLADAARRLEYALEPLPRPWIGVLVGGDDLPSALDPDRARDLGRRACRHARDTGGSLVIAPWPGIRPDAIDALISVLECPAHRPAAGRDAAIASYYGCLALADRFIVTGDSADALAATCARRRPVAVFGLAPRFDGRARWAQAVRWLLDGSTRHRSHRGTPRQQDWRGRILDWLVTSGRLRSTHDPRPLLAACLLSGLATRLDDDVTDGPRGPAPPPAGDLIRRRVRQLLSYQCS